MLEYIIDTFIGILIGFVAGLFGVGGGFLIVPTLTLMSVPIHVSIGTSLSCIAVSSLASSYSHFRKERVLFKVSMLKEIFSIPFAILGAYLTIFLNTTQLVIAFSIVLIYVAYRMAKENGINDAGKSYDKTKINYKAVPLVGIIAGLSSGLLGISGGILNVPLFYSLTGIPIHYAIATSSFAIFFTSLAGALGHYSLGQVDLGKVILLAPGLIIGGYVGAKMSHKIKQEKLRKWFSIMLIMIGIMMLIKEFGLWF